MLITHFSSKPHFSTEIIQHLQKLILLDPMASAVVRDCQHTVATVISEIELLKSSLGSASMIAEGYTQLLIATQTPSKQLETRAVMRLERKWIGLIALDGEKLFLRELQPPSPPTAPPTSADTSSSKTDLFETDDSRQEPRKVILYYGESGIGKTFRMVSSIKENEIGLFLSLSVADMFCIVKDCNFDDTTSDTAMNCVVTLMIAVYPQFKASSSGKFPAFGETRLVLGVDECGGSRCAPFVRALIRHCVAVESRVKERWKLISFRFLLAGTGVESPTNHAGSDLSAYTAMLISRPKTQDVKLFKNALYFYMEPVFEEYQRIRKIDGSVRHMLDIFFVQLLTYPEIQKAITNGRLSRLLARGISYIPFELWKSHEVRSHINGAISVASCQYRRENGLSAKSEYELSILSLGVLNVLVTDTCDWTVSDRLSRSGVITDTAHFVAASDFDSETMIEVALPEGASSVDRLVYLSNTKRFCVSPAMRFMIISRFGLARFGTGEDFESTMMAFVEMTALVHAGKSLKSLLLGLHNDKSFGTLQAICDSIGQGCTDDYLDMVTPKANDHRGSVVLNVSGKMEVQPSMSLVVLARKDIATLNVLNETLAKAQAEHDGCRLALVHSPSDGEEDNESAASTLTEVAKRQVLIKTIRAALTSDMSVVYEGNGQFFLGTGEYSCVLPPDAQPLTLNKSLPFLVYMLPEPAARVGERMLHYLPKIPVEVSAWLRSAQHGDLLLVRNGAKSSYADIILFIKGMHMLLFQCKNCQTEMTSGHVARELHKMGHPHYDDDAQEGVTAARAAVDLEDDAMQRKTPGGHKLTQQLQVLCGVPAEHVTYCFLLNAPSKLRAGQAPGIGTKLKAGTTHVIAHYIFANDLQMVVEQPESIARQMTGTAVIGSDSQDPNSTSPPHRRSCERK